MRFLKYCPYLLFSNYGGPTLPNLLLSVFASPESLLQVISQEEMIESVEDGDRIIIDQDGNASVNFKSKEVSQDYKRHINALKRL